MSFSLLSIKKTNASNNNSYIISNASLSESQVNQLFNSLDSGAVDDLYIDDYYQGVYFSNLRENIGNNRYGSCSYVAIGMLLSFYDSYWSDLFISETYDIESTSTFVTNPSIDFSFPSFYIESPGVAFEPTEDAESSHWRENSHEKLTNSIGKATIQYYWENQWVDKLDLLSKLAALPTNRNSHKFYKIEFDNPVYRIRFYADSFSTNTNDSNRGRICIGNMAIYPSEYNLPLSGSELDYSTSIWSGTPERNNNCYAYALNNQVVPGTTSIWYKQQPGKYSGNICYTYDKAHIVNAVTADFAKYNIVYGTNLLFLKLEEMKNVQVVHIKLLL